MSMVIKNKYKKSERRQKEILKAQAKTFLRYSQTDSNNSGDKKNYIDVNLDKKMNALNLKVIKSDLIKTAAYVVFTIIIVFVIKKFNLESYLSIYK